MHKKDTSWNAVAPWYDTLVEGAGSYQQEVILPNILRLAGDIKGKKIFDLACGQGFFAHKFSAAGAVVTGLDASDNLIEIAKKSSGGKGVPHFLTGTAESLPKELITGSFDLVVCILALQNIKELDATLGGVARALSAKGRFLIVLNHPAFRIPRRSEWGVDEKTSTQYRRIDGYLSESAAEISMNPSKKESAVTYSFHRPLQVYMKMLAKHDFSITRLEEWISHKTSESGPRKQMEDRARKEFPLFLFLECTKGKI
ncbi:MAG: hypothetical protein A2664_02535 [Candidatus Taylorbacteria bacterium RIFCSPHIGHO2_01_FULL_46_22b]|uniref:Methyltransferase type 11 domain-containing protein n=1 Tax=Candidatus Taylorbacteria bacterium RIFCSPHIGHO2_01_FULL_46_22b TaxID=1802301 RepID=A0A1G2M335_9BACT|nr:MAG: hypothetical protein A2664_02535 [Candidatus Taylorbacteria bacterium RIFCSPHIGHO2_01_FULL_46_22b]